MPLAGGHGIGRASGPGRQHRADVRIGEHTRASTPSSITSNGSGSTALPTVRWARTSAVARWCRGWMARWACLRSRTGSPAGMLLVSAAELQAELHRACPFLRIPRVRCSLGYGKPPASRAGGARVPTTTSVSERRRRRRSSRRIHRFRLHRAVGPAGGHRHRSPPLGAGARPLDLTSTMPVVSPRSRGQVALLDGRPRAGRRRASGCCGSPRRLISIAASCR